MVCKLSQVTDFIREHKLLEDLDDETIKVSFDSFPHCCSWDKGLGFSEVDADRIDIVVDKVMEVLDDNYEHEFTPPMIKEIATAFMGVFEAAGAPKKPVPFVVVILSRI